MSRQTKKTTLSKFLTGSEGTAQKMNNKERNHKDTTTDLETNKIPERSVKK